MYEARKLRRQMSLPETLLWQRLRRKSVGVAFRRQHPIGRYKADFYCASLKIVIELDGEVHNRGDQPARDTERDHYMREGGYRVIRIAAIDVLRDPDGVANSIGLLVASPLHHRASAAVPLPASGEEQKA